ncbi:MAG TPA: hypothetical protein VG962_00455 [Steroidobacteraceae bacterium]|nr:hypothetical protein [Steroidobacteraceae bacterium]
MTRRAQQRSEHLRQAIADEAARIMLEQGVKDFLLAKRKAAERLGVNDNTILPKNAEIETALQLRQRLFNAQHDNQLSSLRHSALRLMQMFQEFQPRLVGSVLSGTATAHSDINVHIFADHAERISLKLSERGIAHDHGEKKLRYDSDRYISYPSFKFIAGRHAVEIVVLPEDGIRQSPLSPVDSRPMQRASIAELETLMRQ